MRHMIMVVLIAAALAGGCGPVKPMTEDEFKGFCYQYSGSRQQSCDTIPICDDYSVVMSKPQGSLQKCLDECKAIYGPQASRYNFNDCAGAAQNASDWCQRYCRTNYPQ